MDFSKIGLSDKELLSKVYQTFNTALEKLRKYQAKLEKQISTLKNELTLKNEEMNDILESLSTGLMVTDLSGKIIRCNQPSLKLLESSAEDVLDRNINQLLKHQILPEKLDLKGLATVEQNLTQEFSKVKQNQEKLILSSSTSLMKSTTTGQARGIIINLEDITLFKNLQEDAERKNRLTAMGEIAANVAHEIRNPLGGIELFISMLKKDLQEDPEKSEVIAHVQSGIRSMNHIISNLLEYTKPRPIARTKINMHALVKEFIGFSGYLATYQGIELITELNADNYFINGDSELLKQVLHNLFVNATQAMIDGGKLTISVKSKIETSPKKLALFRKGFLGSQSSMPILILKVEDEGKGMTPDVKRKVFDPFFTTKEKGTGLGMFLLRNIIESHGGTIFVDSTPDIGTTITIELPQSADHNKQVNEHKPRKK